MYVGRQMHLEWELVKWLGLLALASALAIAIANRAIGEQPRIGSEPLPLPAAIHAWSAPLGDHDLSQAADPEWAAALDANTEAWRLLELHHRGQPEAAKLGWQGYQLPCEREVWRFVALGVAHLQLGELDRAVEALRAADELHPDHALVHYYRGILWVMRGDSRVEWYDRVERSRAQFASCSRVSPRRDALLCSRVSPRRDALLESYDRVERSRAQFASYSPVPLPKGMCELAAMTELERAIAQAGAIDLAVPLIDIPEHLGLPYDETSQLVVPTVGDLLLALGADNFAGKARNALSYMYLERGWLVQAEEHMDQASETGRRIIHGYQDLGARYESNGQPSDAARAYLKAIAHGDGFAWPAKKALENLGKIFTRN